MLKKRNTSVHIYDEVDEMIVLIRDSFIPAFTALGNVLKAKLDGIDEDWE